MTENKRRIEKKSSRTAGFNCMYRAASYMTENELYKSDDYIAPKLLPKFLYFLVKNELINFNWNFFPKGIYEYIIARTKYIDNVFKESIENGITQILILGSGFDSRSVRFGEKNSNIKIYDMDSIHTQKEKIEQFRKRKIDIPSNTIFVPIDFNKESIEEKLGAYGFEKNIKTLYILEGLIMYLNKESVDELFELIFKLSGKGSRVVFDYIYASVLRKENIYYGEANIYKKVNSVKESWIFGIEKGEIEKYLMSHKYEMIENLSSEDLERRYFKDSSDKIIGKINGTHCIAYAKK